MCNYNYLCNKRVFINLRVIVTVLEEDMDLVQENFMVI